jgi:hypothetical protein
VERLANLVDRLRYGAVVDFLDFYLGSYHWPAFNVADFRYIFVEWACCWCLLSKKTSDNNTKGMKKQHCFSPGQGSQYVGMATEFVSQHGACSEVHGKRRRKSVRLISVISSSKVPKRP